MSIRASNDAAHSLGPQALGVVGHEVWIADERGLLATDSQGEIRWQRAHAELGVKGVSTILAVDHDRVLIASRDDALLKLVSAADARLLRDIPLQFPADMANRASHVLWMATRPVGDAGNFEIAVATGGDHMVLRFSDEGKFLARTKEGLYRFTNGIWFADGGWWTTDTNRFYLRKLDPETLAQTEEIRLSDDQPQRFLGEAVASHGEAAGNGAQPLATICRFQGNMINGRVVDVFQDASERDYPLPGDAEPMDLGWLDNQLLVLEGSTGTVLHFNPMRQALGEFGGDRLHERFEESRQPRASGKRAHFIWLLAALLCFLLAVAFLVLARRTTDVERVAQPALPVPDIATVLRLAIIAAWPQLLLLTMPVMMRLFAHDLPNWFPLLFRKTHNMPLAWSFWIVAVAMFGVWSARRVSRQMRDPKFEPLHNYFALRWLHTSRDWRMAVRQGETPREVIACRGPKAGILLLTSERLIFFRRGISTAAPDASWERSKIVGAKFDESDGAQGWRRLKRLIVGPHLAVDLRDGTRMVFRIAPVCTARRMAALIDGVPAPQGKSSMSHAAIGKSEVGTVHLQVLAAALLPGLGQWMQRRNARALAFFIYAMIIFVFLMLPVAWALVARFTDVSRNTINAALLIWIALCTISATETWMMRRFYGK